MTQPLMPARPSPPDKLADLLALLAALRDPSGGSPWEKEQTLESIIPFTLSETQEVAEAVAKNDMAALKLELGDLLLQVIFLSQIASERGAFTFTDVVSGLYDKLEHRLPHMFGRAPMPESAKAQREAWIRIKQQEKNK
jgi:ATP diphosphatase